MSRANPTPASDPNQTVKIKSSSGGPPESPHPSSGGPGRGWVVPVVVILLVAAAVILIGVAKRVEPRDTSREPAPTVETLAAPATIAPPEIPPVPEVATNTSTPPAAPEPKLQGIGFRAARPWAIVDGKTVYVGDRVGGGRHVKEISPSTVTLEDTNGTLQTLFLHK
jgi:hypothetical protein